MAASRSTFCLATLRFVTLCLINCSIPRFSISFEGSVAVQPAPFNTMTTYSAATRQLARIQMHVQIAASGAGPTSASRSETARGSETATPSPHHERIEGYDSTEAAVADSTQLACE